MNQESLTDGLKFANKHNLSQREIEALMLFLGEDLTAAQAAEKLGVKSMTTMYHLIGRLRLKSILILKERNEKGTETYQFNAEILK